MKRKLSSALLCILLALIFSANPWTFYGNGIANATTENTDQTFNQASIANNAKPMASTEETEVSTPKQLELNNILTNGDFEAGSTGFSSTNYSVVTETDGNSYAYVKYAVNYRCFVSQQTSLKANTTYTFSIDYFITSDNPNMFFLGLSTVAGHPGAGQSIMPNGTAPYTITNLDTNAVIQSSTTNTSLTHYGCGTRTLAVDGVNRSNNNETGGWRRYTTTFTLSSDAPSVYFYFMSYEQGKQADGTTPLTYATNKVICYDNIVLTKQLNSGNHIPNGNFSSGMDGFHSAVTLNNYSVLTASDGNMYGEVTFDSNYRLFVSDQTSLKANTTYTYSVDYFVPSDYRNQLAFGLSAIAGHPGVGQTLPVNGTAPYTITNLSNGSVLASSSTNASLLRFSRGARTLAVDGVDRTAYSDIGIWVRYSTTFTLSSDAPSVYFYFMSYEQGKKADGITPLEYIANKKVDLDNITIKGLYDVSVSSDFGGKANTLILDSTTAGKVSEGGRVLYTAKPALQNAFAGWRDDDDNIISTDMEYLATPSDPSHLTATFTAHNGVNTYGGEYGADDESTDASSTATKAVEPNTSGILSLGSAHTKATASAANQKFRANQATVTADTNYTLSFYLYGTAASSFGLYRDTGTTVVASGTDVATLTKYSVTTSGETYLGSSQLSSTAYTTISGELNQWIHYTITFHTASYSGAAYFALNIPSTSDYYLIDKLSLTKSSSVTIIPANGGTVSSSQFGGTISTSTTETFLTGTYINLKATPDTGKSFIAWTDENNIPVSQNRNFTVCVDKAKTLNPLFDTGNKVYNGDFSENVTNWTAYGETASNAAIDVLSSDALAEENVPAAPSGNSALKLSFDRTDGIANKRVQAYSTVTFPTENNKTYEVSVWVYSKYEYAKLAFYVPKTSIPYQVDATNDFTYVGSGFNIGATQLAGTYQYLLNDKLQSSTGNCSSYTNLKRSIDCVGNQNGWTKMSIVFTTDDNANCVKDASISLGTRNYTKDGVSYNTGAVYFTDVSVKTYDSLEVENNKTAGNVTANDKVVISSLQDNLLFGKPLELKADPYEGFLFDGWYKDGAATPITQEQETTVIYTGDVSYQAKYRYDTSVPNLFLNDLENLPNGTSIENTGSNDLGVWRLLAESTGSYLSWGVYDVTDGSTVGITPRGGKNMLACYGRYNISNRTLNVMPNTNYMFSFYWYQNTAASNALNYVSITTNNSNIKVGSSSERTAYPNEFLAYNYSSITSNGTWRKYTLTFNSGNNETLKLFMKYSSSLTNASNYLYLDDFSLLPINTETSTGTITSLSVSNNTAPLNTTFTGISSTVYHCFTYMDDTYGRNYTDEMAEYELDRLQASGTKLVRTMFKSQFAWDDTLGDWNWNSQRMQDAYQWAGQLQERGIDIALNAGWSLAYLVEGSSSIPEVSYLYAGGNYTLACARYAEWITEALQAFEDNGCYNIKYLVGFTESSTPTVSNPEGAHAAQWVQAINTLDSALRLAGIRDKYKIVGPNQANDNGNGLLDYVLKNGDSAIDIYSTHTYPASASITDDVFGTLTNTIFGSYMNTMSSNNSTKDFWVDELFCKQSDTMLGTDMPWSGTQTAVAMTSAMNNGVEGVVSWQLLDQLWVDQTNTSTSGTRFVDGIHTSGTAPSLFVSAVPRTQYYALTLMSKYFGYQNGQVYSSTSPGASGLYISTVKMEDGSWTVMVVNASTTTKKFETTFATAINQTLYRHLYDPNTVEPDARAKVIPADKVYNNVGLSFIDSIPSGGVAVYTGLDF